MRADDRAFPGKEAPRVKRRLPSALERSGNSRASTMRQRRQQHLLDVKVRSRKATEHRNNKIVAWVCRLVIFSAVVVGAVVGARMALKKFLWENPDFQVADINVKTDGSLTRDEILDAAEIHSGENIFRVKLNAAHDRLQKLAQVQRVEIERHLPNQISVVVEERHPVAWITDARDDSAAQGEGKYVSDALGSVIRLDRVLPEYYHLPVIRGVTTANLASGQTVNTPEVRAALQLLDVNGDNPRMHIRAVDVSKGYCLLVTDDTHAVYTFGLQHVSDQIDKLNRVFDFAETSKQQIQTVNLLVQRNVPVTWAAPTEEALDDPDAGAPGANPSLSPAGKSSAPVPKASPSKSPISAKSKPQKKTSEPTHSPSHSKEPSVRRAQPVHPSSSPSLSSRHG